MKTSIAPYPAPRRNWSAAGLVVFIAAVAIGLRFWRLGWGLPEQLGFPDEVWIFNRYASAFSPLSWSSFEQRNPLYPTFYGYLVGLAGVSLRALGIIDGNLAAHTTGAFIAGRTVSALTGVLAVALVGIVAGRMYSRAVGFAAAALMAVAPLHALYAHVASTDLTLSACVAFAMLCAQRAAGSTRTSPFAATGVAAGLAFATKYTGLAMLALGAWIVVERWLAERTLRCAIRGALAVGLGFVAGTAIGCPPCVASPGGMLGGMRSLYMQTTFFYDGFANNHLVPTLGWYGRPYLYQLVASLPFSLGWPLYTAALAGVVLAVRRHEQSDRLLLVLLGSFFLYMGTSRVVFPRYLMPLFPALVILAARALLELRRPPWAGRALLAAVWIYTVGLTTTQVARFSYDQQRGVAAWIAAATKGSEAVRVGHPPAILDYFRLERTLRMHGLRSVELSDGHWFDDPPPFIVVPEWYEISIARDRPDGRVAADLARLRSGTAGYRTGPRWRSRYLQSDFYTWLDPAFAADLWQGEIGFTIFIRDDVATNDVPAQAP